jgi:flagellar biosynthesis protein FlhF
MVHAREAGEMPAALEGLAACELILIDTAGVSQRDDRHLAELRDLLAAAGADQAHLVLSAAGSHASCAQAVHKFVRIGATHLVFTKLDESPEPADALTAAIGCGKPVSYVADGQRVPEDLRAADEACLASVLMQEPDCAAAGLKQRA